MNYLVVFIVFLGQLKRSNLASKKLPLVLFILEISAKDSEGGRIYCAFEDIAAWCG
jgi:hypothetical protein